MNKKRSFTLVEILAVLAISGILIVGTVVGVNTLWQNNRVDICESEMRDFSNAFKSYLTDYRSITAEPDSNYEDVMNSVVEILNSKYLPCDIMVAGIADDKKSITLKTNIKEDPWGNKYEFYIYTYSGEDSTSPPGLVIISSYGRDSKSNKSEYKNGVYGDDVITAFPSWGFPAQTKRRTEGIRVPVPLAWGGSSTARVLLRLCPESACQPGPSLELSPRLEEGGCAVRASPGRLGSLAQEQTN